MAGSPVFGQIDVPYRAQSAMHMQTQSWEGGSFCAITAVDYIFQRGTSSARVWCSCTAM